MIVEIIICLLTILLGYFLYLHKRAHNYFEKNGVKYLPGVPIFGNVFSSTFLRCHVVDDIDKLYRAFPEEKYVGLIEGTTPVYLIRDPELIKNITIKDFDSFMNHRPFLSEEVDPLFGGSLIFMKDERWHDMRSTLSPAFTSSKMKKMMPFMTEISSNIIEHLRGHINEEIDVEDVMRRYTSDVIASAAFGYQVNSLKDVDNKFYKTGQSLFKFTNTQRFMMFFISLFPNLSKKLGIRIFPAKVTNFFNQLVTSTINHREKNNIERPDMIQLLMEASKGSLKIENDTSDEYSTSHDYFKPKAVQRQWTQTELAGQAFVFFAAGFEGSAATLVMCVHELAINTDPQEKLYKEIRKFEEKNKELTYDNITELKYLDCVLNETLRKWSSAMTLDRICTKTYELLPPRKGGKPVQLTPGDFVYNVGTAIHMDPAYYPEPTKFDPDRFSEQNKHKLKPNTYMPFGLGPRICIGKAYYVGSES